MISRDMVEVYAIENACFDHPWTEDEFARALRARNCIGMVCEYDERVIAHFIYDLEQTGIFLRSMAVLPEFQHCGVGRQILAKLIDKLSLNRRDRLHTKVRESNLGALKFFRACGFRATRIEHDAWEDSDEDAYLMEFRLGQHHRNTPEDSL